MKRKILFILLIAGFAVIASAQGRGQDPSPEQTVDQRSSSSRVQRGFPAPEAVTISGSLVVARSSPALVSGDVTYLISGLTRLFGFIDGLKEGAQVTIEGTALSRTQDSKVKLLRPAKLTLGGKTYDMASPVGNLGPMGALRFQAPSPSPNLYRQPAPPPRLYRQPAPPPRSYRQPAPPAPKNPRQQFKRPNENLRRGRSKIL